MSFARTSHEALAERPRTGRRARRGGARALEPPHLQQEIGTSTQSSRRVIRISRRRSVISVVLCRRGIRGSARPPITSRTWPVERWAASIRKWITRRRKGHADECRFEVHDPLDARAPLVEVDGDDDPIYMLPGGVRRPLTARANDGAPRSCERGPCGSSASRRRRRCAPPSSLPTRRLARSPKCGAASSPSSPRSGGSRSRRSDGLAYAVSSFKRRAPGPVLALWFLLTDDVR